ncbi:hypothetical protein B0T19DRAFT_161530 [Cercophora scortea]|uniref:Alcohol dehydrogenase-like C-terminal domain-containing protein n=1 Tax=Cercophora scortea TaxID=314031 RepID=A0AAE0IN18_9PEZI|nr:hypothetical protein B0T19DRAFT_161530 [Cercophora scortea]
MAPWPSSHPQWDFEALYHDPTTSKCHVGPTSLPDPTILTPRGHVIQVVAVALTRDEFSWSGPKSVCNPIPGYEFSGHVVSAPISSPFKPGTHVFCTTAIQRHGNARSYTVASFNEMCVQPPNFSFEQCAAIPRNALQAFQTLFDSGILVKPPSAKPALSHPFPSLMSPAFAVLPERNRRTMLLIMGAASAVGQWAVQLARQFGCGFIVATCSKDDMEHVRRLGAHDVLDWDTPEGSLKHMKRSKFSAVFDCVGGIMLRLAWWRVKSTGIIASVVESPCKALSEWKGPMPHATPYWAEVEPNQRDLEIISGLLRNGHLKFHHDPADNFDLKDYDKALERLKTNSRGKVVLRINTQKPAKMIEFLEAYGDVESDDASSDVFVDDHICDSDCKRDCELDRMMDEPENSKQDDDNKEATQHTPDPEKGKGVDRGTGDDKEIPDDVEMRDLDASDGLLGQLEAEIINQVRRHGVPAEPGVEDTLGGPDKRLLQRIRTAVHQLQEDESVTQLLPISQTLTWLSTDDCHRLRESKRMRQLFALVFYEFVHNSPPAEDLGTTDLDHLPSRSPPSYDPPPSYSPPSVPESQPDAAAQGDCRSLFISPPNSPSPPIQRQGQQKQQSQTEMPPPPLPLSRQRQQSPGAVTSSPRPQPQQLPPSPQPSLEQQPGSPSPVAPPPLGALPGSRTSLLESGLTEAERIALEQLQSLAVASRNSEENASANSAASLNPPESESSTADVGMGEEQDGAMNLDP